MQTENASSPKERGNRLKLLRSATLQSRMAFAKKHGIPKGTLQNWEDGRYGGLSERGAKKVLGALKSEDIHCSIEWLLYNTGPAPVIPDLARQQGISTGAPPVATTEDPLLMGALFDEDLITQELQLFHRLHANAIDTIIADDGMAPRLWKGDYVAGKRCFSFEIKKILGLDCIIQTKAGETLVRTLQPGSQEGRYNLVCANPDISTAHKPVLEDVDVFSAAPVIWVRRKDPIANQLEETATEQATMTSQAEEAKLLADVEELMREQLAEEAEQQQSS